MCISNFTSKSVLLIITFWNVCFKSQTGVSQQARCRMWNSATPLPLFETHTADHPDAYRSTTSPSCRTAQWRHHLNDSFILCVSFYFSHTSFSHFHGHKNRKKVQKKNIHQLFFFFQQHQVKSGVPLTVINTTCNRKLTETNLDSNDSVLVKKRRQYFTGWFIDQVREGLPLSSYHLSAFYFLDCLSSSNERFLIVVLRLGRFGGPIVCFFVYFFFQSLPDI